VVLDYCPSLSYNVVVIQKPVKLLGKQIISFHKHKRAGIFKKVIRYTEKFMESTKASVIF
jgi:hypothetical protein